MKKVIAIIQARTGSTRLPGKVLIKIKDKTVLNHIIDRLRKCKNIDNIIIATTVLERDNLIVEEAKKINCDYYIGSEENVLNRYYEAAKLYNGDIIIRITSDCPLIDPKVIDNMIEFYLNNNYDLVSNSSSYNNNSKYPRGLDTEIFSFDLLKHIQKHANKTYQLEHVTSYIYENNYNIYYYSNDKDYSNYRLTLDTKEDLKLIESIYDKLYVGSHDFYLNDIIKVLKDNPRLQELNLKTVQKKIR